MRRGLVATPLRATFEFLGQPDVDQCFGGDAALAGANRQLLSQFGIQNRDETTSLNIHLEAGLASLAPVVGQIMSIPELGSLFHAVEVVGNRIAVFPISCPKPFAARLSTTSRSQTMPFSFIAAASGRFSPHSRNSINFLRREGWLRPFQPSNQ